MRSVVPASLLLLGFLSLRCNGSAPIEDGLGGAEASGGSGGSGGTEASGGAASGGGAGDCEAQVCCIAQETYCVGDDIWRRPLDPACTEAPEFRQECPYGCAVSSLYQFAYCEDAPQGGAGGVGGEGGMGGG